MNKIDAEVCLILAINNIHLLIEELNKGENSLPIKLIQAFLK